MRIMAPLPLAGREIAIACGCTELLLVIFSFF
jgi:hypothetical protein